MTDNSPKAIVLRATELFDGTRAGTDRYLEMFAESAVWQFAPTAESLQWRRAEGREAARQLYYRVYRQRRDVSTTIHDVVADGPASALARRYNCPLATADRSLAAAMSASGGPGTGLLIE